MSVAEMSDSGIGWIGKIPTHWQIRKFRYCGTIPNGQVDPRLPEFRDQILVAPNHIKSGTGRLLGTATAEEQGAESGKYLFRAGDVLYSKIRPELAKVCLIDFPGLCSADMYPISPNRDLYPGFLAYQMICIGFTESVVLASARVAMPKVNRDELGGISLVIPPRPEQKTISTFLDRKTAQIDTLIAKKQRLIELLQEKRQALISRAVTKGLDPNVPMKDSGVEWLGEIPTHWTVLRLKQLCFVLQDGTHLPPPRTDSGFPLLSVRNIVDGRFVNLPDDSMISEEDFRELTKTVRPQVGDVLLAIVGATMGKVAIVEEMPPFAIQRSLGIFRTAPRLMNPEYLGYWLRGWFFQRLLWENTGYSAQPGIYLGALADFPATVPPLDEQQQLVESLNDSVGRIDRASEKLRVQITKLQEYRQTLISAAVTGKIDVRKEAHP